jgi:antitoxin HicB
MTKRKNPQIGGLFDDWMKSEGIYEEATNRAIKEVLAWQLDQSMKEQNITKVEMAKRLETSRAQLDRILDPSNNGVTLDALSRAAAALGRKLRLELV